MKRIFFGALVAALLVGVAQPARAQTYFNSTTTAAAVNATQNQFNVALGTNISAGYQIYIEHELIQVAAISGTRVTVRRGVAPTQAAPHRSGATVIIIPAGAPTQPIPEANTSCTASHYQYLPIIDFKTGNVWLCWGRAGAAGTVWKATNTAVITYDSLLVNLQ